ncbi:LysR family transcriptional regulator [Paraburkholderia sp. UCT31]|uniref:LysR family transcriptional regulator n=1 Tax=Paraburkholderia sp. UCT31 TaxID=2615209 RepID=UPI00223BA66C|nr:LysR family transcriptional regulator [Paraburkholderia sp. UCT31]
MDKFMSMRIFSRVVEAGSFSVVAEHMSCSKGNVSRAVLSLEDQLQARLLQRTTRRVSLTEPGKRYYQKCKRVLADLDDAEAEARDAHTRARKTLRSLRNRSRPRTVDALDHRISQAFSCRFSAS